MSPYRLCQIRFEPKSQDPKQGEAKLRTSTACPSSSFSSVGESKIAFYHVPVHTARCTYIAHASHHTQTNLKPPLRARQLYMQHQWECRWHAGSCSRRGGPCYCDALGGLGGSKFLALSCRASAAHTSSCICNCKSSLALPSVTSIKIFGLQTKTKRHTVFLRDIWQQSIKHHSLANSKLTACAKFGLNPKAKIPNKERQNSERALHVPLLLFHQWANQRSHSIMCRCTQRGAHTLHMRLTIHKRTSSPLISRQSQAYGIQVLRHIGTRDTDATPQQVLGHQPRREIRTV